MVEMQHTKGFLQVSEAAGLQACENVPIRFDELPDHESYHDLKP
jgi:hypothetical protein